MNITTEPFDDGTSMNKRLIPDVLAAAVAKLIAAGWSKERIIQEFAPHYTKHDIPAAAARAQELGFLRKPTLNLRACEARGISPKQIDAVILGADLTAGFRTRSSSLRSIHVFYPADTMATADIDDRLAKFAPFAARTLAAIMTRHRSRSIGVSWGLSPRLVVEAMAGLTIDSGSRPTVFPLCGLPLHTHPGNRTASESAATLHDILNGASEPFRFSMPLVPALVPAGAEAPFQVLLDRYSQGYQEIFGSGPIGNRTGGLVDDVDMIITSVSSQEALGGLLEAEVVALATAGSLPELRRRVEGDIAGVLLRKEFGPDPLLDAFDRHWTGITRSALETVGSAWNSRPLRLREALHVGHSTWEMSAMKSIRWLAVVASLAIALAVIRAVLGESLVGVAMFFVVAMLVVQYVLGGRNWFRAVVAGLVAMAAYTMYSRLLPADTVTNTTLSG